MIDQNYKYKNPKTVADIRVYKFGSSWKWEVGINDPPKDKPKNIWGFGSSKEEALKLAQQSVEIVTGDHETQTNRR
jgi:hypothetical protein